MRRHILYIERIKEDAKINLSGYWSKAVIITILVWLLTSAFTQGKVVEFSQSGTQVSRFNSADFISFIISGPLAFGVAKFYMNAQAGYSVDVGVIFDGFKDIRRTFVFHMVSTILIVLWAILFIIPGIIASIRYSMGYYIMIENPDVEPLEALKMSSEMIDGYKMDFFRLVLSFAGWFLLSVVTFGIGFLYLVPYYQMSKLNFYKGLKNDLEDKNYE